jgi:hypothetical protein
MLITRRNIDDKMQGELTRGGRNTSSNGGGSSNGINNNNANVNNLNGYINLQIGSQPSISTSQLYQSNTAGILSKKRADGGSNGE